LDQSKARSGRFENSPCGLRQLKAFILPFAKIDFQNVLMTAQNDLSNSPLNIKYWLCSLKGRDLFFLSELNI
jgi:hypothetical protein